MGPYFNGGLWLCSVSEFRLGDQIVFHATRWILAIHGELYLFRIIRMEPYAYGEKQKYVSERVHISSVLNHRSDSSLNLRSVELRISVAELTGSGVLCTMASIAAEPAISPIEELALRPYQSPRLAKRHSLQRHNSNLENTLRHFRFETESGLDRFKGFKSSRIITRRKRRLPSRKDLLQGGYVFLRVAAAVEEKASDKNRQ